MSEREKAEETYRIYRYDRENGHEQYIRRAEEAHRYYASQQWSEEDAARRRQEERPMVTVNEIFETVNAISGELSQLSTDVAFQADVGGDPATADILNKMSEYVDRQNKLYIHDDRVRRDGLLTGRGFYEIRVEFDDNLQGNIRIRSRRPQNVILPADLEEADPSTWSRVCTTDILSLQDVEELFGDSVARELRGMPLPDFYDAEDKNLASVLGYNSMYREMGHFDEDTNPFIRKYRMISMQYQELKWKDFFVDVDTGDMAEIPENWPREKVEYAIQTLGLATTRKKAKTVRWRVVLNDLVVHDEDSPYKFYTIVPYFPFLLDGATLSLFDVLKGPQDLLNKSLSEEIHILTSVAASGWKVKEGSLRNMTPRELETRGARNGLVMVLEDIGDAEKIQGNSTPAGFQDLSARAQQWTKQLAGLTPSMQGAQRADASGKGIQLQLNRAPVNLSTALTAFHFTKHLLAERKLNLFQTYYTETRFMRVQHGRYGHTEEIGINVPTVDGYLHDITSGNYYVDTVPVTSRLQAEEYAFDELVKLKELGLQVPNRLFIEASSINAKPDAAAALREANSGELSPEEQMARQLELQKMQLEVEAEAADVENKRAQTVLALGRARRAAADAQTPAARLAVDANRQRLEAERDARAADLARRKHEADVALQLTEMEHRMELERERIQASKEAARAAAKVEPPADNTPSKQPRQRK